MGNRKKECFIVMPISDREPYSRGHFERVYSYILKPACELAELNPIRADEVQETNVIILDVLKRVIEADMVLCDLSGQNPNVMYELGIRQAFNRPVTLVKDSSTRRIFDIQGLRDVEYDRDLRVDLVKEAVEAIGHALRANLSSGRDGVNSLVQLLNMRPASLADEEASDAEARANEVLDSLMAGSNAFRALSKDHKVVVVGQVVYHKDHGGGTVADIKYSPDGETIVVMFEKEMIEFSPDEFL